MLPMRSMVLSKSKPWNMLVVEVFAAASASRKISGWCSRRYSPAATRKPAVPQAGSQMTSFGRGRGHLDHQPDDVARRAELAVLPGAWRSCRACIRRGRPWCRGPPSATSSIMSTTLASSAGVGMVKRASFMWCA